MPVNGLRIIRPSSVSSTGTGASATIRSDSSVSFSSCLTLGLRGVFINGGGALGMSPMRMVSLSVQTSSPTLIWFNFLDATVVQNSVDSYHNAGLKASSAIMYLVPENAQVGGIGYHEGAAIQQAYTMYIFGADSSTSKSVIINGMDLFSAELPTLTINGFTHATTNGNFDGMQISAISPMTGFITVHEFHFDSNT